MTIEPISKENLRKYESNKGFVFSANSPSSDAAIKNLCHVLIARKITKVLPQLVDRYENSVIFVYGDDFDGPMFFAGARLAEQMGVAKIESISEFISRI
jgi:hypothetical protein